VCAGGNVDDNQKVEPETENLYASPTNGLGSWIWEEEVTNNQTCQLWNTFEIPESGKVTKARIVMTVDNEFTLYLDGRELGRGVEWRELYIFDLTTLLTPGRHVLAVHEQHRSVRQIQHARSKGSGVVERAAATGNAHLRKRVDGVVNQVAAEVFHHEMH
jgi:hypothetical protein